MHLSWIWDVTHGSGGTRNGDAWVGSIREVLSLWWSNLYGWVGLSRIWSVHNSFFVFLCYTYYEVYGLSIIFLLKIFVWIYVLPYLLHEP